MRCLTDRWLGVPTAGSKVEALDVAGTWLEATLVNERGEGDARELLVHYNGWKERYDEWLGAGSGRLRAVGSGTLGQCKLVAAALKMEAGSSVHAQDPRGDWYKASVVEERGEGLSRQLLVHYERYGYGMRRLDEWVGVCSGRLRAVGGKLPQSEATEAFAPKPAYSGAAPPPACAPLAAPPRAPATMAEAAEACGAPSVAGGAAACRSASAPNTCAGDTVTTATHVPSALAPDAFNLTQVQPLEPQGCLTDRWLGVPTEHFGRPSLGLARYLGKVSHEEDDQVFFVLVIDSNEHSAPRSTVREWLIPVEEIASAVKGLLQTSPSEQTRAAVSVPARAAAPARTAAARAPRQPAPAPSVAAAAAGSDGTVPGTVPAAALVPVQAPSEGDDAVEMDEVGEVGEVAPCELWEKGSKLEALDVASTWYEAKLVDERGEGDARELLVHYNGWKARYDEWLGAGSGRLRAVGSGTLGQCKLVAAALKMEAGSSVRAQDPRGDWYKASVA